MQPENPQPNQPQPTPVPPFQPAQPAVPPAQPQSFGATQPSAFPQPAASAQVVTGMKPPTTANLAKQKKLALILAIVSIVIFVAGLLVGYTWAYAAILGAYAVVIGVRTKAIPTIILGAIGLVLNLGLYILSVVVNG